MGPVVPSPHKRVSPEAEEVLPVPHLPGPPTGDFNERARCRAGEPSFGFSLLPISRG